jgi:predicted component of type VI protein secretion system
LSLALLDLVGLSPQSTVEEIGTPPLRLLRYLSLLLPHPRPASGLAVLLGEELGLAITIEQGVARACLLPPAQWSRVSVDPDQGGCLGRDLVLGAHRWDRSGELRLHIGPVSAETLDRLLPQGILWRRLVALARYYLQQPLDLRLHVQVPAAQVAPARLGGERPTRLGGPAAAGPVRADPVVFAISAPLSDGVPIARWTRGLAAAGSAASEKTGVSA